MLDLVRDPALPWHDAVRPLSVPDAPVLHLINAGRFDADYPRRPHEVDWKQASTEGLAERAEDWRDAWSAEADIILCDSRTGLSDLGGISTIHMPDVLVVLITPSDQSVDGVERAALACREQQAHIPFTRAPLRIVPIPTRIDQA